MPHKPDNATQKYENLLTVLEQANRIASMTSLDDLLSQMLDLMIQVSGATNGTLFLLDHEAHEIIFKVVRGNAKDQELTGKRIKENVGIVGAVIQRGQPIVIEDLASDPRWYREFKPELVARLRNAITLPLLLQGKPIGAAQIFNFECKEIELLQLLSSRMASEVDKTLLLEKAVCSNQRLQAVVDVLGQVAATLDRDQLLNIVTDHAARLLDGESSSVFLVNGGGEESAQLLSRSAQDPRQSVGGFLARSVVSVPLSARPIIVGKERKQLEERIIGNLMVLNKHHGVFDSEDMQLLEILASQASTVLQIATLYTQASELFLEFIEVLTATIDAKDPYTRGHSKRVSNFSVTIAENLGFNGDALHDIRMGSLLHDIGKLGIPDHILTKPDRLTNEEYEQIKKHPGIGFKIMEPVHLMNNVLPAIMEHHERLDGTGYPLGLHNEQVSVMGRIVAVADVYDALTSDRPYRKKMDLESVLDYLRKNIDTHFDPICVEALTHLVLQQNKPYEPA
jgi:putative nucleotidyltransferase with HDIG domain